MSRRGFALVTVLWMVAALSVTAALTLAKVRVGSRASANRILLSRAEWAREACVEILQARFARDTTVRGLDTIALGRGTWCVARMEDPGNRLPLNTASAESLRRVLGHASGVAGRSLDPQRVDSLVDAVLDWRDADDRPRHLGAETEWYRRHRRRPPRNGPLSDAAELRYVRGFDLSLVDAVTPLVTARGTGRINLNTAPPAVLRSLALLDPRAVDRLIAARRAGRVFREHPELVDLVGDAGVIGSAEQYRSLVQRTTLTSQRLVALVEGGVGSSPLTSRVTITFIPVAARLAAGRRESS